MGPVCLLGVWFLSSFPTKPRRWDSGFARDCFRRQPHRPGFALWSFAGRSRACTFRVAGPQCSAWGREGTCGSPRPLLPLGFQGLALAPEAPARTQLSAGLRVQGTVERNLPGGRGPHGLAGFSRVLRGGEMRTGSAPPSLAFDRKRAKCRGPRSSDPRVEAT